VQLVVVTLGDKGITAYRENEQISVDAVKVVVADTVGAGDTVGAVLVEAIVKNGLYKLTGEVLKTMLNRATKAAAITVSRTGANPPSKEEID
jgi:fructokinase